MNDLPDSLRYGDLVASRYLIRLLIDPTTGRLLDASQAAADFYGYSREELRQLSAWDLTPLCAREETLALLAEIASGRDLRVRPGSQHRRHSGEWCEVMVYPDLVGHDRRVLILYTIADATELGLTPARRRRGEERASEQRLGALVEQGLAGVAEADLDGRLTRVNARFCQLIGHPRERLLGQPIQTFMVPEDRAACQALIHRLVQGAPPAVIEERYRRQDGGLVHAQVAVTLMRDAAGGPAGFLALVTDITAHRVAEDGLRVTEERLRLALEGARMGTWHWDLVTNEVIWSDMCCVLFGVPPGTPSSWDRFIASVHPQQRAAAERAVRGALEAHTDYMDEYLIVWPDGSEHWIRARGRFYCAADGTPRRMEGVVQDITEAKALRQALEHERAHLEDLVAARTTELKALAERLQLATEAGRIGVFDMDMTTGRISWDDRLRALYGVPDAAPELSWQTWLEWVAPAHHGVLQDSFARILRGEETTYQGVLLVHCPDGQDRYVASRARLLEDPAGTSRHLVGINWDVTAERTTALALAASEAKARAVIESSPVPLAIAEESGPVRYLNAAFVQTFGYTLEDIPTMDDWRRLAYPDPVERARILRLRQERLAQVAREGGTCEPLEVRVRGKDGTLRTVMTRATLLEGEERLNTLYDITDLKQAQAAAEQAARAKSEFLAHMSHEIRSPLNVVLGLVQVLEQGTLDPDQRAMVAQVRSAGRSLLGILNDILDLSKIEAGQFPLDTCTFELAPLLARVESLLGASAHGKGLRLAIDPPPVLECGLLGDPLRLEQVLVNLVGNAIKFTDRGEVQVRVATLELTAERVRLRFEVRDTGLGIAPETLDRLFTPFTQADGGITRRFGGTGLGLAICKRLVEAMGGVIGAASEPGAGSTFWFEVPFAVESASSRLEAGPAGPVPAAAPAGPRLAGLHLLVVDDSAMNREVVERMLALEGARATPALDGRQAVERLRTLPSGFDAVLMDVQMPVMDGLTATRLIRTELGLTELPIFALTAGVLAEEQTAARTAGVNGFLPKPLDLEALVAVVRQWVGPGAATGTRDSGASADQTEAFPALPGIDRGRAAHALDHDLAFFRRLLARFAEESADAVAVTRRALAAGERETAMRRMHTLKGHAGTLGALDIMTAAGGLLEAMRRGQPGLDARLAVLDTQVAALIAAGTAWCETSETCETTRVPIVEATVAPSTPQANILIVDDDPTAIQALYHAVSDLGRIRYTTSGRDALDLLARHPCDLVLLDANMPGLDGFATCEAIRADYPELPVLFVTTDSDFATEVRALESGARDFIVKPVNPPVVRARVGVHLQLKALSDRWHDLSGRDPLTGLANRRALDERVAQEWRRAARHRQPLGLLMIDIDHFKRYNDHYGHLQGDDCLRQVARILVESVSRTGELVARYGGEEFAVLLPGSDTAAALVLAEKIRAALGRRAIPHACSETAPLVTLSLGAASVRPLIPARDPGASPTSPAAPGEAGLHLARDLFDRADQALYAAKAAGRNRVSVGDAEPNGSGR